MSFQYESDKIRYDKLSSALTHLSDEDITDNWTEEDLESEDDLTKVVAVKIRDGILVKYGELWNHNCFEALFQKKEYEGLEKTPLKAVYKFYKERFIPIAQSLGLKIIDFDVEPSYYSDEVVLMVEMVKYDKEMTTNLEEFMLQEADFLKQKTAGDPRYQKDPMHVRSDLPIDTVKTPSEHGGYENVRVEPDNRFNKVYMTQNRPQDPKIVDRYLKNIFEEKFKPTYTLKTDVGGWHPVKTLKDEQNKLVIHWEHEQTNKVKIITEFFKDDTNNIFVSVVTGTGDVLINTTFEIYRIPTDSFLAERFIRKVYFSLLKKFINTQVIKQEPFRRSFVFWKANNPSFSYSFSEPKKNQIVLNLIDFIKTAQKPILDDFFEQHNLRHKQGYLQTLLDASEDAGIFDFKRQGNEVIVQKGPNFKAFLEGRIRKF